MRTPCAECQHLGDTAFPVMERYAGGELKTRLIGYSDRPNGEPVENPARRCNHPKAEKRLVYENLGSQSRCPYFEQRDWTRPETCGECQLGELRLDENMVKCGGHPWCGYHARDEKACINGRVGRISQPVLF